MVVRLVPRVVVLLVHQEPVVPVRDYRAVSKSSLSYHLQCLGFLSCEGERMFALSAHAGHPNHPEGGLVIDPSGCRGIV
eukprot:388318-Pyramimonas_sp.AAC.1